MPGSIVVRGARQHNLKNVDVVIPRERLVVVTGLSGSGKSSLAFDTIYAEGQRRYVESLSAHARQFLAQMEKPDCDSIEGLSPAIAIEQKGLSRNPRSTVGTISEIYDYLRLLFARVGRPFCCRCGRPIVRHTVEQIVDRVMALPAQSRVQVLAPIVRGQKGEFRRELQALRRAGFVRVRIDGELYELTEPPALARNAVHTIEVLVDRLMVRAGIERRLADSLDLALRRGDDVVCLEVDVPEGGHQSLLFSQRPACAACGVAYPEITPGLFSFNSPHGACPGCGGLGVQVRIDPSLVVACPEKPLAAGGLAPVVARAVPLGAIVRSLGRRYGFGPESTFASLPPAARAALLEGEREEGGVRESSRRGGERAFPGLLALLARRHRRAGSTRLREDLERLMDSRPCPACGGARLRAESLAVRVGGRNIAEVSALSVGAARDFLQGLELSGQEAEIGRPILAQLLDRLRFLADVGLDYLTLDRRATTLSGGEGQRTRLATQIGARLSGIVYVLDEPSIGLHPRDNARLLAAVRGLRDLGNTVIVVEHDRDTILAADHVIDLGPGAGAKGGEVVAEGPPAAIMSSPRSLTGRYLSGELSLPVPEKRRPGKGAKLVLSGATHNNLRNITVEVPLGTLTCVTGVSGSGKSSLVIDTLYRALAARLHGARARPGAFAELRGWELLDKVIDVDQAPIGRTPRSNPATFSGLFAPLRELFAALPEARTRGYGPGRFSFNVKGGRCEACHGDGLVRIEMHFLPDVYVACEVCRGRRYNRETLEVTYKGLSIADVLDLTVDEALAFLSTIPPVRQKLEALAEAGLGYIRLGQPATTLSGGEAQRLKLARELCRRATGRTLYVLDEPTTGLHFDDVRRLLGVLLRLVEGGNTVVVIEHNLDVVRAADYVIDLGPEGGEGGGRVVAAGTPEEVSAVAESHTGRLLARALAGSPQGPPLTSHRRDELDRARP